MQQKKKTTINAFGKSVDFSKAEPHATAGNAIGSLRRKSQERKDIMSLAKRSEKKGYDASQVAYDQRKDRAMTAKSKGPIAERPFSRMAKKNINPRKEYSE